MVVVNSRYGISIKDTLPTMSAGGLNYISTVRVYVKRTSFGEFIRPLRTDLIRVFILFQSNDRI